MARRIALLLLLAACAALAGCGSSGPAGPGSRPAASSGRALFSQACGACHTLTGADDPRKQGGDLLHLHATGAQLLQFAAEMPLRRPLGSAQLRAVVRFVMAQEGRRS